MIKWCSFPAGTKAVKIPFALSHQVQEGPKLGVGQCLLDFHRKLIKGLALCITPDINVFFSPLDLL